MVMECTVKNTKQENGKNTGNNTNAAKFPPFTIDWDLYASYLEGSDLSDKEKRDFIETLWSIVTSFVDLGFSVHPTQQTLANECGKNSNFPIYQIQPY